MNDRVPLDREEAVFASWLATLDDPKTSPALRAQALKHVAEMYMGARADNVSLLAQLDSAQRENGELREYRRKVVALTLETKVAGYVVHLDSARRGPHAATLVPLQLVPAPKEGA